jgi:hypothetical protein
LPSGPKSIISSPSFVGVMLCQRRGLLLQTTTSSVKRTPSLPVNYQLCATGARPTRSRLEIKGHHNACQHVDYNEKAIGDRYPQIA